MGNAKTKELLKLTLVEGFGPVTIKKILRICPDLSLLFSLPKRDLEQFFPLPPFVLKKIEEQKKSTQLQETWEKEIFLLEQHQVQLVSIFDLSYPSLLKQIYDPPPILYIQGQLEGFFGPFLSMVGTRNATHYGVQQTRKCVEQLAVLLPKVNIVSGLALGIDSIAHQTALDHGLKTTAVLANGLKSIYPLQNRNLAEKILEQGGVLISEQRMEMEPKKQFFPLRNRIISGLSQCLLVMEAGVKSGSLITARHAFEQNREVFVLPGLLDSESYAGNFQLLEKEKASVFTSVGRFLEIFNPMDPFFVKPKEEKKLEEKQSEPHLFSFFENLEEEDEKEKQELQKKMQASSFSMEQKDLSENLFGKNGLDQQEKKAKAAQMENFSTLEKMKIRPVENQKQEEISFLQKQILDCLSSGPRPLEGLCSDLALDVSLVLANLFALELLKKIQENPPGIYALHPKYVHIFSFTEKIRE